MDADYYYAGGLRLVQGHGFTETYLWNYLDNPQQLPHPSNGYWFPLASILAAAGMLLTGQAAFWSARLGFILTAALVSPITALLSYKLTSKRENAIAAGLLAIFSGYYAAFMPTTDNFGIYMLLGGLFFLILLQQGGAAPLLLGLVAGFMNLSRVDGLIWLLVGAVGLLISWFQTGSHPKPGILFQTVSIFLAGYFLVMGAWLVRDTLIWGTPFNPAGSKMLFMTGYEDTFAWPAGSITLQNWLASGWGPILAARLDALKSNFLNTIGVQGGLLLFPFILAGLWTLRKNLSIRLATAVWVMLFLALSLIFPFAGSRGSFFHAGAALQPLWYAAAVAGLDALISFARAHGRFTPAALPIFRFSMVLFMASLTVFLAYTALISNDWDQFRRAYNQTEAYLIHNGAQPADVVVVSNPPGYFAASGRSAVVVPSGKLESINALAVLFGAKFLVLEKTYYPDIFIPIYNSPYGQPGLTYLGEQDGNRIFLINP